VCAVEGSGYSITTRSRAAVAIFISLGLVSTALTMLWLGMRAVMDIGGFCAEGGPFVIEHHCPKGVAAIMPLSIWGGVIAGGVYVWQTIKHKVPSLVWLFWPALFLSLGWNFLQYGVDPPGVATGLVWGWLVCGIVFALMGAVPLLVALPFMVRAYRRHDDDSVATPRPLAGLTPEVVRAATDTLSALRKLRRSGALEQALVDGMGTVGPDTTPSADDVVSRLERLDALHRSGALDDAEYQAAKQALLKERR
jgi:Short C-terminal domain